MVKPQKKRVLRSKADQRADSIEQILDAAEYLFSKNGLHGVSLRDVAKQVGIHTTLVHYYFKDKQDLFESVFARRAGVSIEGRMEALKKYEEAGTSPLSRARTRSDTDLTSTSRASTG